MGRADLLAQSTAGIAPSAVIAAGPCVVAAAAGSGTLWSYFVSMVVILLVGWCFCLAAQLRPGSTVLSNITATFGRGVGFVGSVGLAFGYTLVAVAAVALFAFYTKSLARSFVAPVGSQIGRHESMSTIILEAVCVGLVAFMTIRGVKISARISLALEVFSVSAMLLVLCLALLQRGLSFAPFVPVGLTAGQVVAGMVLAILGYVGFESAACLGVEAKTPHRSIPRAVFGSAWLAGGLYMFAAYAQLVGLGGAERLSQETTPLNALADAVGLHGLGVVVDIGVMASCFACVASSLTAASRLLHAMGEDRLLHARIAVAHWRWRTPYGAILALSACCLAVAAGMSLGGVAEFSVYTYAGVIGTFGYMLAYVLSALGIPVLIRRFAPEARVWLAAAFGLVAAGALGYVFFRSVYRASTWPVGALAWAFVGVLAAAAAWYAAGPSRASDSKRARVLAESAG